MSTQQLGAFQTRALVVAAVSKQTGPSPSISSSLSSLSFHVPADNKLLGSPRLRLRMSPANRKAAARSVISNANDAGCTTTTTVREFLIDQGLVHSQRFVVRSFDVDWDQKATVAALMRYMQDSGLAHAASVVPEGFALSSYMVTNNLGWVLTSFQILVDRYPSWRDALQVETWSYTTGKNAVGNDWMIRDEKTGETLVQASNVCVMMDMKTRRLRKLVQQVRDELAPYMVPLSEPILPLDDRIIAKPDFQRADYVRKGLKPGWCDLDINKHVNNTKYVDWILDSAPIWLVEGYKLSAMTMKFRKECNVDSVVDSLSKLNENGNGDGGVELEHLLCLEDGSEVLRARTSWKSNS